MTSDYKNNVSNFMCSYIKTIDEGEMSCPKYICCHGVVVGPGDGGKKAIHLNVRVQGDKIAF